MLKSGLQIQMKVRKRTLRSLVQGKEVRLDHPYMYCSAKSRDEKFQDCKTDQNRWSRIAELVQKRRTAFFFFGGGGGPLIIFKDIWVPKNRDFVEIGCRKPWKLSSQQITKKKCEKKIWESETEHTFRIFQRLCCFSIPLTHFDPQHTYRASMPWRCPWFPAIYKSFAC